MSLLRFAAWGAVGGFLLAMPMAMPLLLLLAATDPTGLYWFGSSVVMALLGAGSAAGSLALARRADDTEPSPARFRLEATLHPKYLSVCTETRMREVDPKSGG